ncbi:hypothetical protein [Lentzea aerocolonigenes]|uniref:hypothetical protein n=1 Tax=Lentzea aerocolonigenes TaxID=68170 RepID=UPI0004C40DDB|nr:hypothetical protein [Lentzea aerocolonigenes]MCP2248984.1 hypothetical protein [Lentzea aerocolonigenes]
MRHGGMSFGPRDDSGFFEIFETGYRNAGIHPAWIHAFRENPNWDFSFHSESQRRTWQDAVDQYVRDHPDTRPPDHPDELVKWRAHQLLQPLRMAEAVDDPDVVEWMRQPEENHRNRGLARFLLDTREELLTEFRTHDPLRRGALALAERWGGPELVREVEDCLDVDAPAGLPALTVIAVARLRVKPA